MIFILKTVILGHLKVMQGHFYPFLALQWVSDSSNCLISKDCTKLKFFLWLILKVHLLGSTFWPDTQYVPLSNSQKLDFSKKKLDLWDFQDFRTKWTYSWIIMVLWVEFAPHGKFFLNRDDFYTFNSHSRSFKGHARSFLAHF